MPTLSDEQQAQLVSLFTAVLTAKASEETTLDALTDARQAQNDAHASAALTDQRLIEAQAAATMADAAVAPSDAAALTAFTSHGTASNLSSGALQAFRVAFVAAGFKLADEPGGPPPALP